MTETKKQIVEQLPSSETNDRLKRLRQNLVKFAPEAQGLLVFSRLNLYYFSGSPAGGVLWLPLEGEPVLAIRRAEIRARGESPLEHIEKFKSFSELPGLADKVGSPWPAANSKIAVEMGGLQWSLAENLKGRLNSWQFIPGDEAINRTRAVKSSYELNKLRRAGELHGQALNTLLPQRIKPGMTEREITWVLWGIYGELGHAGPFRTQYPGDELFMGIVSAGAAANFPSHFNGPLGHYGEHPATPSAGSPLRTWQPGELLAVDTCFSIEGYQTDKTRFYYAGRAKNIPAEIVRIHEDTLELATEIASDFRPGVLASDLYKKALALAQKKGLDKGFMGCTEDKVPFLGHGIGLAVDEWPPLAARFESPLEEGMVLALEPKIGLPGVGMVGMEETYLVTEKGGQTLTGGTGPIIAVEDLTS